MTALLLGSISTLADTSEIQRDAFNRAFAQHGLDWEWGQEEYRGLLQGNGGKDRVADYARERGQDVDAAAVHATKSELYQAALAEADIAPRDGVVETIRQAQEAGTKVALVTTTSRDNIDALGRALAAHLDLSGLDLVVDASQVDASKPDPAAYRYALQQLGEEPGACVAVEDNVGGVQAANAAGVASVAFPNENTAGHDFSAASGRLEQLTLVDLQEYLAAS
ncbi:Protein CbbY [Nocardioides aquaticus]|jgi:HAD superfamily hydrolase (TIGR01509 family)|uniref:Protein CbbY n=1 Tax=Nocardioides aquaticus TaxID=160826 RepID=A0ABX8ED17_9ACTN|nr:HAD-IA family hydrolase [Nocardioides aquaticus]QVT78294.1 Protein CbbY [Nocardioides aquaticus]